MYHKEHAPAQYTLSDTDPHNVHVLFRRSFLLAKQPGRYILRISADDYGKYYINGKFIGQGPTPDYLENYQYNEFDITPYLTEGENVFVAHVYYQGLVNRVWISGDLCMGLIADILTPDGKVLLSTDESWGFAVLRNFTETHKFSYDTQFAENYDSRVPIPEFQPVALRGDNGITFAPKPAQAIQISHRKPVLTRELPDGGTFYDFGQEITGTLRIVAKGKAGERIRILCGEELDDSPIGVRYDMRCYCRYEEYWTLADGENVLEQYDYKAFRYVALIPEAATTQIADLTAVVRHAPFDDDLCNLECDDVILKQVFELCKNGVKYGTQEVYTDCPSREKGQYAGDMTVTSGSQLWLTGDVYMLEKGIRAHISSTKICKGFMAVLSGALMQEIADYSLQFPLLLLRHYSFTKDKAFLGEMLPYAEDMLGYFEAFDRGDGLLEGVEEKWNLVDWPKNLRDGYDFELTNPIGKGVHNVINAFYVGATKNVERIKEILGIPHEHKSQKLAAAFNRVFLSTETGLYVDSEGSKHSSLHANILPAFYEFAPEENKAAIRDFLKGKGMACGVYMSYFLLRALCRLGAQEYVYDCIVSQGENSWYNMIRDGATTCMEAWGKDKKFNTSFCHPWSSAPICILIEELLGVSYDGTVGQCCLPEKAGKVTMQIPTAKGILRITRGV
ncbi:MAG: family 78 glycoside hydrolase catalytic domain [Oscillospiraceae bacterium]|nr:family 78 glycoside hydrolase catalytic domain [Oscillospiraceae bacterium]